MKYLKKILILCMLSFLFSLFVVGASAAFPDQDHIENQMAVNMNTALGIIKGREDGKFDPLGTTTRAEMTKMICIILNKGSEPMLNTKAVSSFRDTKGHWAESYIEYCTSLGIVAGMGDGTFHPNDKVTGTQAAKMLLVALGYDAPYEGFNGTSWSLKINVVAYQKALYDNLSIDPNAFLSRDSAAQMIWNALGATMVKYTYGVTNLNGKLQGTKVAGEYSDYRTLLQSQFAATSAQGKLNRFSYNALKSEWSYEIVDEASNPLAFSTGQNLTTLYGQNVCVVYKLEGGRVYGIFAEKSAVLFSGILDDLLVKSDGLKFDSTTYALDSGTTADTKAYAFTYDTAFDQSQSTLLSALTKVQRTYRFAAIDQDEDRKVDFLVIYPYTVQKVSYVEPNWVVAGDTYRVSDCEVYDGIAKDQYTKITAASNTAKGMTKLERVDKMVSGTVTKVRGNDYTIDETEYKLADGVSMAIGDTIKNAAVVNQFIFAAKVSPLSTQDYAIVVDAVAGSENGIYGDQAKLLFTDGKKLIVSTDRAYLALKGRLVTYHINRYGSYELKLVDYSSAMESCFDKAIESGMDKITSGGSASNVQFIDHCMIADDAIVFVREGDGSAEKPFAFRVITGATLLKTKNEGLSLMGAFADQASSGDYYAVKLAYLSSNDELTSAETKYGYAVFDYAVVKNKFNETVYEYTLWDGSKEITVLAQYGLQTPVYEGDVLSYTLNTDGFIDHVKVFKTSGMNPSPEVSAITALDTAALKLNGSSTTYQIDPNKTKIIYIDSEEMKGKESGSLQLARRDGDGNYIPNALVLTDGSTVSLIVFDLSGHIIPPQ